MSENHIRTDDGIRLYFETRGSGPAVIIPNGIIYLEDFRELARERTLIAYDPRNRGQSDATGKGDIEQDVEDLEAVRRYFDIRQMDLMGHSVLGLMVALYAMRHPEHTGRVVQIGPMEPYAGKQYPAHVSNQDGLAAEVFGRMGRIYQARKTEDDVEMCRKIWAVLNALYVVDPANAVKIDWGRCELANERNFMGYWTQRLLPSILKLNIPEEARKATAPVLTIHGTKDRNAPYGAGRDWAHLLPNGRLLTIEGAAHAPWIEAPERVLGAMKTFFAGEWPAGAEEVTSPGTSAASAA